MWILLALFYPACQCQRWVYWALLLLPVLLLGRQRVADGIFCGVTGFCCCRFSVAACVDDAGSGVMVGRSTLEVTLEG